MSTGVKLESKLAHGNNLPFFLQRRIQFREALNEESAVASSFSYASSAKRKPSEMVVDKNGFQEASQELFASEAIKGMMQWSKVGSIGPGLSNLGNTCFLNSVMQCLTYTPPLANYLLTGDHTKKCRVEGYCLVCELERHFKRALVNSPDRPKVISPNGTVGHLKWIAKHMRVGRQEDSHEFLRFVIEGMQKNFLAGYDVKKMDARVKETTLIHQVFGGYLHSRVHCLTCTHTSHTFDPLLDLSLEVRQADSVSRGLQQFVRPERLSKANRYRCDHCGKLSDADKSMSIYRAPNILTVHLKRFNLTPFGEASKINKHVEFGTELEIGAFITGPKQECSDYDLYGVLVHEGQTCNSGHYHSFVKASNGFWYSMNDSSVHQVSLSTVLKQRAYLLFYARRMEASAKTMETEPKVQVPAVTQKPAKTSHVRASELPTPPATPEPQMIKDELAIISNSMWHLSTAPSVVNCKLDRARSRPNSSWIIKSIAN
ncbi:Peptidase C19, ubiquitin carboxyl-terminal hydrolase 2 domain-containing protein [Paramicrosporidium saccamoebae]|uniref:Ubiquitin carboxyl-terminal hydrolase n=1 Tax=Paramicrosporidium saccamoebae TaxID=1246581 RepID=A0A2H9TN55_9FUNG|nr:Peptidase C19, ubiquitin carboxyl-terminal hydrolase 2 domain-containing protein [Paramicrosporidium saccamoebae]